MAWSRFLTLDRADRARAREAAVLLVLVAAGLRVVAFPTLCRWLGRWARPTLPARPDAARVPAARTAWAVAAAARRLPGTTCLVQALVGEAMLRRRGYAPEVRFGVRDRTVSRGLLAAHAWVECEGAVVIGAIDGLEDFVVLATPEVS
jgi:hypothetical protein